MSKPYLVSLPCTESYYTEPGPTEKCGIHLIKASHIIIDPFTYMNMHVFIYVYISIHICVNMRTYSYEYIDTYYM